MSARVGYRQNWNSWPVGSRVRRISGKNRGREGRITESFSVSGMFTIQYDNGKVAALCNPENFARL